MLLLFIEIKLKFTKLETEDVARVAASVANSAISYSYQIWSFSNGKIVKCWLEEILAIIEIKKSIGNIPNYYCYCTLPLYKDVVFFQIFC